MGQGSDETNMSDPNATYVMRPEEHEPQSEGDVSPDDIAQTRAEMTGTLAALGEKLDPHVLADEAKDVAADTAQHVKDTVTEILHQIKETLPEAASHAARNAVSSAVDEAKQAISKGLHTSGTAIGNAAGSAQRALGDAAGSAQRAIGGATGTAVTAVRGASGNLMSAIDGTTPDGAGVTLQGITMTLTERIKSNPPAAVLAGLGLYLLFRGAGTSTVAVPVPSGRPNPLSDAAASVSDAAASAGASVSQAASAAGSKIGDVAGTVQQKAGDVVGQVQGAASSLGTQVQDKAHQGGDALQHLLQDNPLAVGGIALGLGALVGLALPSTTPEQKLMGTASTAVVQKAQDAVQDKVQDLNEKVQNIAGIAGDAVSNIKESVTKSS